MSDELVPIDIHYNKLTDWLISRRHCSQGWQKSTYVIREKINNAIQDMPAVDELTTLLQGTYINYFHCLRIVELLRETESNTKNIFGNYSSQRMKDWLEILKLYEKECVYLAEAAQMLIRNVNYEIPSFKKQISKCQQIQNECTRKESEYLANAAEFKEKFHHQCKVMGIEGKKIKKELINLVKDLPTVLEGIIQSTRALQPAIDFYSAFILFTVKMPDFSNSCCPMLSYVIHKGLTTTFEWRTGQKPSTVELPSLDILAQEDYCLEEAQEEIDWGDSAGIDFDISLDTDGEIVDLTEGVIEVSGSGLDCDENTEITVDKTDVARGEDALTVLENTKTRNAFLDDLYELEAFLSQRLQEMQDDTNNVVDTGQFQTAPASLHVDTNTVQSMLGKVSAILAELTSNRLQQLFMIRSSPRYVDRVADNLKQVLWSSEKMLASQRLMVNQREEALQDQRTVEPKLDILRKKNKQLKLQIEEEISKKYKNRPVNIMGEINTV